MRSDQINLSFEIIAEADDSWAALLHPRVGYTAQFASFQATIVKLRLKVGVERIVQVVLELTVQKTLLAGIKGNIDLVDGAGPDVASWLKRCVVGL